MTRGEEDSETFTHLLVHRSSPAVWQELLGITGKQTEHWQPHVENWLRLTNGIVIGYGYLIELAEKKVFLTNIY